MHASPGPCAPATDAKDAGPRRLCVYNGGFLTQRRVRRILALAGWRVSLGLPGPGDWVGVWGQSPTAHRGEAIAARRGAPILRVEDAFLRSLHPGRAGREPPLGLLLDRTGVHFDPARPSDIETLLATHPLDDTALLDRARAGIDWMRAAHLSKYTAFDPAAPVPRAPYVLVIDQTRGDASVRASGADAATFRDMLIRARAENPGMPVVIKTHPETAAGHRAGHFGPEDADEGVTLLSAPVSPWALFEGAVAVYTVSSQLGFEAIFAGHRPRVFGQPFYAGWGLTDDLTPHPRRGRRLTRAQLFAAAMILYPTWYDPCRDRLASFEEAAAQLEAETRAWREDHKGHVAVGMRLWKRAHLQRFFGRHRRLVFQNDPARAVTRARAEGRGILVWAGKATAELDAAPVPVARVEDGFLRSRGLGAALVPPLSLVTDDLGIYYDPGRESRLERLIAEAAALPRERLARAEALVAMLTRERLSKYNLAARPLPDLPAGRRILVPGQVEDDASIETGCGEVRSNAALLAATRAANPDAVILYKPHPDVEAGLRAGRLSEAEALAHADMVLTQADPVALIEAVDEVWTMTSLLGFEALLRGRQVTCLGAPFYAGWGLTRDLGPVPERRRARPSLAALAHAALIAYPRYLDPATGLPCPPEVAAERLARGPLPRPGRLNRALAKLQGVFASQAWLWR
ncbi:MAG: capsular polysaccharide biosynthesis protein [Alphaproteobacteria bacterium]|nr:MAG: capsular polysaccharide biosynthesis protein [Alphaproteobacteria bacterium]